MATTERPREMIPADDVERIIAERVAALTAESVATEVARQLDGISSKFAARKTDGPPNDGDTSWMEALAMAIAGVTDQEIGRRRIAPEEVKKRAHAFEKMQDLIEKTIAAGVQPTYSLRAKNYLGNQMIAPLWVDRATRTTQATEIGWWTIPNQSMHPINDEAKAIHALFLEWIGAPAMGKVALRITPGGLVVRSGGMPADGGRDQAPRAGRDIYAPTVTSKGAQQSSIETRILGTLMEPARQMV